MLAVEAALHAAADDEHRRSRAVVGTAAAVLRHAAAEVAERHREHALIIAVRREIGVECADTVGEIGQQSVLRRLLRRVRVERAKLHVEHARAELRSDDLRCQRKAVAERRFRIRRRRLVARNEFWQLFGAALRVIFDRRDLRQVRRAERHVVVATKAWNSSRPSVLLRSLVRPYPLSWAIAATST